VLAANIRKAKTKYGEMAYYADDKYIGKSLELWGEYCECEVALWRKFVKPGWRVIDGGANIGVLTVPLAEMVGYEGMVHAFEPQEELFELLKQNADRPNVRLFQVALGSADGGQVAVPFLNELATTNYGCVQTGWGSGRADVRTIDALFANKQIDFIKLDIEGAETFALEGARAAIARCRPVLYVENHPAYKNNDIKLIRLIRSLGYRNYYHFGPLFNEDNINRVKENPFGDVASVNLLCIPVEKKEEYAHVTNAFSRPQA